MKLIEVKNVSFSYPSNVPFWRKKPEEKLTISKLSFDLRAGERLALVGKNGSGKSTTLRLMAKIYPINDGQIITNGNIQTLFNVGIGMRKELTGRENIKLQCLIAELDRRLIEKLTREIIDFTDLGDFIDQPMRVYSAGMAMRLKFAVATSLSPDILLLDEWIGAGDKAFQDKAHRRLSEMVKSAKGLVLASHNAHIVRKYCTSAVWLEAGRIVLAGNVDEVLDAYLNSSNEESS